MPVIADCNSAPIGMSKNADFNGNNVANRPPNMYGGYILTIKQLGWGMQLALPRDEIHFCLYMRHIIKGSWTNWFTIS